MLLQVFTYYHLYIFYANKMVCNLLIFFFVFIESRRFGKGQRCFGGFLFFNFFFSILVYAVSHYMVKFNFKLL